MELMAWEQATKINWANRIRKENRDYRQHEPEYKQIL